ncbi:MAG: hypothetical protein ABJF11_10790, partial [Reichenbachiella sp.]|uniref:hypothetical protein n=1 Tax=Reichenbachiella sp. TaxID=2184521 RepID=UPI0032674EBD
MKGVDFIRTTIDDFVLRYGLATTASRRALTRVSAELEAAAAARASTAAAAIATAAATASEEAARS